MSYIQSYPTDHGLNVLSSEFKNTATQYVLLGASSHDAPENTWQEFHRANIESSFYDENGVLTFVLNLPIEQDLQKTMHKVLIVDSDNKAVTEAITPKIFLGKGIGGLLTLKTAIQGEAGEVVFKSSEYITEPEMESIWLPPIHKKFDEYLLKNDAWRQPALAIGSKTTETDLNDITDVGFYASNASSNLFKNLPKGYNSGAFTLFVESIDVKSKYRRQTLRSWSDCRDYTRFRDYLGNWSEKWIRTNTTLLDFLVGLTLNDTIINCDRSAIALRADGVEVLRADYPKLWNKMKHTAVDQALINANPKEYAARYGTGDGSTSFTIPNLTLMPWLAVAGFYGAAGTTCNDAIRNITGRLNTNYSIGEGVSTSTGVFQDVHGDSEFGVPFSEANTSLAGDFSFDASRVVPTAEINRPNSSFFDLYIIHGEI